MNTPMTPEAAKQKIIDKVLAAKEGWLPSHVDVFDKSKTNFYRHPDIPEVLVKVFRSFERIPIQYEFSICIDKHVLALEKDPNGPISQIVIAAEKKQVADELSERDKKLISIAQSL